MRTITQFNLCGVEKEPVCFTIQSHVLRPIITSSAIEITGIAIFLVGNLEFRKKQMIMNRFDHITVHSYCEIIKDPVFANCHYVSVLLIFPIESVKIQAFLVYVIKP
jgi:hypothetical protein